MAVGLRYTNSLMRFITAGATTFILRQVDATNFDPGITNMENHSTGVPDRGFIAAGLSRPMVTGDTYEVGRFLTNVSHLVGLAVTSGGSGVEEIDIYYSTKQNKGDRASGANHGMIAVVNALVVPQRLSVRTGAEAKISFAIYPIVTTDSASPFTHTGGQSLYSTSLPNFEKFTLGKTMIAGSQVDDIQEFTLDFGLEIDVQHEGASIFPKFVNIKRRMPVATLRGKDMRRYFTDQAGYLQSGTAIIQYLKKKAEGGNVVADGTAEHISFTFPASKSKIDEGPFGVSGTNEDYDTEIRIIPQKPSASDIFSVNTATTIT